jgi:uncharacterized membrane protein YqiK
VTRPAWLRDEPDLIDAGGAKLRQEIARDRLHTRGTGSLPLDPERARTELEEEQRARRSSRPRGRRWKGLTKHDEKIDTLALELDAAHQELRRAQEVVEQAPDEDARSLAAWMRDGKRGKRPEATLYERQRERDAARLHLEALQRTLDDALEERVAYVERHRDKLLADARRDLEAAHRQLYEHVRGLPVLRDDLLTAREALAWVAAFPEQAQSFGFEHALALGLLEPVKSTLATTAQIDYRRVVAALEADADTLRDRHHEDVQRRLGTAPPRTPLTEAMWTEDEDYKTWQRQELERARRLAEWRDPNKLAEEARDLRP